MFAFAAVASAPLALTRAVHRPRCRRVTTRERAQWRRRPVLLAERGPASGDEHTRDTAPYKSSSPPPPPPPQPARGPGLVLPPLQPHELTARPVDDPNDASQAEESKPTALPFDSLRFAGPVVRRFLHDDADAEEWRMYYYGRALDFHDHSVCPLPTGSVGMATSRDGVHWERTRGIERGGALLAPNLDDWWCFDTQHVAVGDVQLLQNERVRAGTSGMAYFMFTFGGDNERVPAQRERPDGGDGGDGSGDGGGDGGGGGGVRGLRMRIGVALSKDGRHWSRLEGEHASGAVLDTGAAGEFDELFCGWPSVVRRPSDGAYLMYYHTLDQRPQRRDAASRAGAGASDEHGGGNGEHRGEAARGGDVGRFVVGLATSHDGVHWRKSEPREPVLTGGATGSGAFDERGIGSRSVIALSPRQRAHVQQWPTAPPDVQFVMFAEGVDADGVHSIGLYASADGVAWRRLRADGAPILTPSARDSGRWDARAVGTPSAVVLDEHMTVRLYYVGFSAETVAVAAATERDTEAGADARGAARRPPAAVNLSAIGMAVSDGDDWRRPFIRWDDATSATARM